MRAVGALDGRRATRALAGAAWLVWLVACGDDRGPDRTGAPIAQIAIVPEHVKLHFGQVVVFSAVGLTEAGDTGSTDIAWSVTRGTTTDVTDRWAARRGRHKARYQAGPTDGTAVITATNPMGLTAAATITVVAPAQGDSGVVLIGAGDIGSCRTDRDEATARILDTVPGTIFTTGDNAYSGGSPEEFADCLDPSWGRHRERMRPTPGNHDYRTSGGAGYFDYFGAAAGERGRGFYSYDYGAWHIVALNSEVAMERGSEQERWLRDDLATSGAECTLAYMHHPRFSSSASHGDQKQTAPLFEALYEAGAEVVIAGHDHTYERFVPQAPDGTADTIRGIRQFVVGTGGRSFYDFGPQPATSEVRYNETAGVLKLTLFPASYRWEFIPVAGAFTDTGIDRCR